MINRFFTTLLLVCIALIAAAQTPADSLTIVQAPWNTTVLQKGLTGKAYNFTSLYGVPLSIALLEVAPDYKLDVLIHAPMATTSASARASGAVAAINGSFFNMKEGFSVCYLQQHHAVVDTTIQSYFDREVGTGAVQMQQGRAKVLPWNQQIEKAWKVDDSSVLVSGPLLLLDAKECDLSACNQNFVVTRHPRSAMGVKKDGTVILLTVDGRLEGHSIGIQLTELAHLLRIVGADSALNLDGGGSTTLWAASAPDNGVLNHPSDNKTVDSGGERKIANSICVYE